MAGYQEDTSQWRLTATPEVGNPIPYKYLGISGGFNYSSGAVTVQVLIPANRLEDFIEYLFPPPAQEGFFEYPQYRTLPGFPSMAATDISFNPFVDGMPIDPFGFDLNAPSGTYHELCLLDVTYNTKKTPGSDPRTFLEISANASGEFLHTTAPGSKYALKYNSKFTVFNALTQKYETKTDLEVTQLYENDPSPGDEIPGKFKDPATGDVFYGTVVNLDPDPIKDPTVPITIMVPTTEWTAVWPRVNYNYFNEVLIHRLRAAMGKVNLKIMPWLHDAEPGTILFAGYSTQEKINWRRGFTNRPPQDVHLKFVEKRVDWEGVLKGHNHVWKPGKGWEELVMDTTEKTMYRAWDLNRLFKRE